MATAPLFYGFYGPTMLAVSWTWTSLAIILYILRASSAVWQKTTDRGTMVRWDFIWVTIAFAAALTAQITTTVSLEYASKPQQGLESIADVIYTGLVANCAAMLSTVFGRFAVVALLLSLHGPTYPKGKLSLWFIAISQFIVVIVQFAITVNQCNPVSKLWNIAIPGSCNLIDLTRKFGYLTGSYAAFCDFYLACYPAALIVGPLQQMKLRLKVVVCVIMAGGVVAGIAGIVKTVKIGSIMHVQFNYATIIMWVLTETWFIIIFGSITTIRPIFVATARHIKLFGSGLFTSATRTSAAGQSVSTELSQRGTKNGSDVEKPIPVSRQGRDLNDDETALRESFAGYRL